MKLKTMLILMFVLHLTACLPLDPDANLKNTFYMKNDSNYELVLKNSCYVEQSIDTRLIAKIGIGQTVALYELNDTEEETCAPHIRLSFAGAMWDERFILSVDDKVVKEWSKFDIGKGIPHHFYDDDSWTLNKYQKKGNTYYTYYDWTYTITDDDLTLEQ